MSRHIVTDTKPTPEHERCGGRKRGEGGGTCQLPAGWGTSHPGIGSCKLHGGGTRNHAKHALKIQAQRDVTAFGGRLDISAPEALIELVQTKAAEVAYWDQRVQTLSDDQRAGMLEAKTEQGFGPQGPVDTTTRQAGPHVFVVMLHQAQDQLASYSAAAIRAGVDKALVEVATLQAAWLIPAILRTINLSRADLATDPQDVARAVLEGVAE